MGLGVSDGNCPLKVLHGCPSLVLPDPPVMFQFNVVMLQCCTATLRKRDILPLVVFLNLLMHSFISVCVCMCVCVCVYTHTHTYIHTHTHTRARAHTHTHTHARIYNTSFSTEQKTLHLLLLLLLLLLAAIEL